MKHTSMRHVEGGWPKDVDFTEQVGNGKWPRVCLYLSMAWARQWSQLLASSRRISKRHSRHSQCFPVHPIDYSMHFV